MTIEFSLDEDDFLTLQLFLSSKSERIKRKRQRSAIGVPIVYFVCGVLLGALGSTALSVTFFVIGFLWFFIYPLWERRHYVKHFQGFIKETYKERIGKLIKLTFENDSISAKDDGSETKILNKEIEEINEIGAAIFVKLKSGSSIILPKNKIKNIPELSSRLKELAIALRVPYNLDFQWKWK